MGEVFLGELLEELDKNFINSTYYGNLERVGFSRQTIRKALDGGLIECNTPDFGPDTPIKLSVNGFLALNQIRLKKATDKLNKGIDNLNQSTTIYNKMTKKYSRILIGVAILTLIVAGINLFIFIFQIFK